MLNNSDLTHISLIALTFFFTATLCWLVLKTLKEGRKALEEINKDNS